MQQHHTRVRTSWYLVRFDLKLHFPPEAIKFYLTALLDLFNVTLTSIREFEIASLYQSIHYTFPEYIPEHKKIVLLIICTAYKSKQFTGHFPRG